MPKDKTGAGESHWKREHSLLRNPAPPQFSLLVRAAT
jgi:hypothetical protein